MLATKEGAEDKLKATIMQPLKEKVAAITQRALVIIIIEEEEGIVIEEEEEIITTFIEAGESALPSYTSIIIITIIITIMQPAKD